MEISFVVTVPTAVNVLGPNVCSIDRLQNAWLPPLSIFEESWPNQKVAALLCVFVSVRTKDVPKFI